MLCLLLFVLHVLLSLHLFISFFYPEDYQFEISDFEYNLFFIHLFTLFIDVMLAVNNCYWLNFIEQFFLF
jgi:hypothetical protein